MTFDLQAQSVRQQPITMFGGLDLQTPPWQLKPGFMRTCQNFECSIYGGYRRIGGYERFDGKAKPSDALYAVISATITGTAAVGNTLTGATSGATGTIIAIAATYFAITKVVGTFASGENLNVGGPTIAVSTTEALVGAAPTQKLHAQYLNLAADVYRALIGAVPGEGKILGVNLYKDTLYAFRNAVGGATAAMYKSTTGGWSLVALGRELAFTSGGTYQIQDGDTITGAVSGATAVVTRVALESGTWAAGTAAGHLIFATQTGTFQAENLNVGANPNVATIAGNSTAITLQPGGRYEFVNANFTGSEDTLRMYGCDGANRAFEFDGTVFVPINTGMVDDRPTHIAFHLYHLFLSFHASVQNSATGFPYQWTPITGASELATGEAVTGFAVQPAGTTAASLAVFTNGKLYILYGTNSSNWTLLPYKDEIGAFAYTIQNLAQTVFLDLQGITDINTTLAFGNFVWATLSTQIKSMVTAWRTQACASSINRDLGQYRLFFSNKYAIYVAMLNRKTIGMTPVLFAHTPWCTAYGKMTDGSEVSFFGSDDGYVFQMDKGTSFDGGDIEAYFDLAWCFSGAQRMLKGYRNGAFEVSGNGYAEFYSSYTLGYGSTEVLQPASQDIVTNFSAGAWDTGNWDVSVWDGQTLMPSTIEVEGEAENISLSVRSVSDYFVPFTITGGLLNYLPRRLMR